MIRINCDLCGKIEEIFYRTLIEGVELNVCSDCSKFGNVISPVKGFTTNENIEENAQPKEEKIELIVENYSDIIKRKRELEGLTQKEFAKKINEKEATIHNIETGALTPSLSFAKKLEKALGVKLIEEYEESHETKKKSRVGGFTLGDFIKPKR
mgnify:CR=1 FL=1